MATPGAGSDQSKTDTLKFYESQRLGIRAHDERDDSCNKGVSLDLLSVLTNSNSSLRDNLLNGIVAIYRPTSNAQDILSPDCRRKKPSSP